MELGGRPIDLTKSYRITDSFLAGGGDDALFSPQRDAVRGMTDIEALEAWVKGGARSPQEEREIDSADGG